MAWRFTAPWGCCWAGWPSPPSTPGRGRCYRPRPPVLSEWAWSSHWSCLLYLGPPWQQLESPLSSDGLEQELRTEVQLTLCLGTICYNIMFFLYYISCFFFVLLTINLKRKSSFTVWYKKKKNRVTWYLLLHCHPPTCAHLAGGKLWWWWWWCGAVDEPSWPHRHSHRWGRPRRGTRTMGPQVCDQVLWVEPPCSLWHSSRCVPVPYSGALRGKEYEETIKY